MKSSEVIKAVLKSYKENELFLASKLYREKLSDQISEAAFYKSLERMCESGELIKIAKGTYHKPKRSKYGIVPPSEKEIVFAFTENGTGMEIGYSLYNSLNLTTQISKTVNILSSTLDGFSKSVRHVVIKKQDLEYTEQVKEMISGLEVLHNFYEIEDINYSAFLSFFEAFANSFDNEVFEKVIGTIKYPKSTIAFAEEVLRYFDASNDLSKYLSTLSTYKYPKMEEIYEAARTEN